MSAENSSLRHIRGLDGIRALSVAAVMAYHLGTTGGPHLLDGGFLGVDVFFVVSGFLITSLLLAEAENTGRISLRAFYVRRARRLLPALYLLLAGVAIAGVSLVPEQLDRLRGDVIAALAYVTNWWLIDQNSSYFGPGGTTPPLLNHLWSLAVEEQFYFVWPLIVIAVVAIFRRAARPLLLVLALAMVAGSALLAAHLYSPFGDPSRVYFGTDTRAAAPLVGAALAIAVRPWREWRVSPIVADGFGLLSLAGLGFVITGLTDTSPQLYRGGFLVVALIAGVFITAVSHPRSTLAGGLDLAPLRWLGVRSYGVYLWHWPVFVLVPNGAFAVPVKLALTLAIAALSYRFVERPIRRGLARGFRRSEGRERRRLVLRVTGFAVVGALVASAAGVRLVMAETTDTQGGLIDAGPARNLGNLTPSGKPSKTAPDAKPWDKPLRVTVFGDSQGKSLLSNRPADLSGYLTATDATISGCGLMQGGVRSRTGEGWDTGKSCPDWQSRWAQKARQHKPQVALVMNGAWDVFDTTVDGTKLVFGTPAWDARFTENLTKGVGELTAAGAQVALSLLPCYRPVKGGSAGYWPERGDDNRTKHVNKLLTAAAAKDPTRVLTVAPPEAFCTDNAIATDTGYRWDGVHYYKAGAALYFKSVIPQLLSVPRPPTG